MNQVAVQFIQAYIPVRTHMDPKFPWEANEVKDIWIEFFERVRSPAGEAAGPINAHIYML